MFAQCAQRRALGDFCGRHSNERKQLPQGVWDPPEHAALPRVKLEQGTCEAKRRAGAASRAAGAQCDGKGKGCGKRGRRVQASLPVVVESVASGGEEVVHAHVPVPVAAASLPAAAQDRTQVQTQG